MALDETIGATLGSYRVTAKLGQGGMGAVYLAEHPLLGRKAAVKVLLPELSSHKDSVERFFHEARTTARLRHPAMVDVFDFGTLPDGRAYLIMDYLEGECLEARIRTRGALPLADALRVAREIALGVSVAHGEQIVHRDLKPDNIFLLPPVAGNLDERVKILDFGIAKLARKPGETGAGMTQVGAVMGTPLYMSPEQCRGAAEVDPRADIYSLGCILVTMLTARPPFLSESMGELMGLHQLAPPPTLESLGVEVPATVERLVRNMLAKSPDARPASMVAVATAIDRILRAQTSRGRRVDRTVSSFPRDGEVSTRRGRGSAQAPLAALTAPDARTEPAASGAMIGDTTANSLKATTPAHNRDTFAGRPVSTRITFTGSRWRTPLLFAGVGLVALSAAGLLLVGRSPDRRSSARATFAPPAVDRAAVRAVVQPSAPALAPVPAVEAAAPALQSPPPIASPAASSPVPAPAIDRRRLDKGRRTPRSASVAAAPTSPLLSPPSSVTKEAPAAAEKDRAPPPPEPTRKPRPVYRGTQLQIEKEVPY